MMLEVTGSPKFSDKNEAAAFAEEGAKSIGRAQIVIKYYNSYYVIPARDLEFIYSTKKGWIKQ